MARAHSALGCWLLCILALALLAAPGCRRRPSPAYQEASALFDTLTNQMGDDAYGDPRMDRVESLLATVPGNSLDAPAAAELSRRIAAGRAAFRELQAEEVPEPAAPEDPWANWTPPPPPPPDAGTGTRFEHPDVGMSVEELKERFSDCFSFKQKVDVKGHGQRELWALADTEACRKAHPDRERTMLVLDEAGKKILGTAPDSAFRYYYPDGGQAPPPAPRK